MPANICVAIHGMRRISKLLSLQVVCKVVTGETTGRTNPHWTKQRHEYLSLSPVLALWHAKISWEIFPHIGSNIVDLIV